MKDFMYWLNKRIMEEATGYDTGGGAPGDKVQTPPTPPTEKEVDDFGYEIEKKAADPATPPKKEDPATPPKDVDAVTGYDKPPAPEEKVDPPATPPATPDPKEKDKGAEEFEVKEPGDLLPVEVQELKDFVKKHKVSKEVAEALVESKKQEVKKLKELVNQRTDAAKKEIEKTRRDWHNELKNDPTFGGEKFAHNVKLADKVINEYMPNVKKMLTERKTMLPPYVMRDLVTLADHLYETEKLVHGDPIVNKPSDKEEDDPLAYYE